MNEKGESKLHIVTVVAVIHDSDGRVLVLKRQDDETVYPGMYTFPGGKVEDFESIEETLEREVREETGLKLKAGKILLKDKSIIRPDGQTSQSFSYLCEVENTTNVHISNDFTDYRWVRLNDLAHLLHVGIEEELEKAEKILQSGIDLEILKTKSVKADLRK
jgi:8-oxo-dGTP pyrophosphatase MutT (NUDIX family)